jgi:hypothetical protein
MVVKFWFEQLTLLMEFDKMLSSFTNCDDKWILLLNKVVG